MTFVQRVPFSARLVAIVVCLALVGGCRSPGRPETDPNRCPQTYEFGNSGCTDIAGHVRNSAGQPLAGISVGPRYFAGREVFNSPYATTDADGAFRLRLTRFAGPAPVSGPDTVSLYLLATDPRSTSPNAPATIRDSVLIQVTIAPVGAVAPVTEIAIRLPTP